MLSYCAEGPVEGFDPARYVTAATFDGSSQVLYNRLVEFQPGTAQVVPGLAESWDISKDGLTYTFHLRADVKFQTTAWFTPKRALNADDVVFSLSRQRDRKNPWFGYGGGLWPYYSAMGLDAEIKAIVKGDAATVKIVLTRPDAGFPADLAMDFASILSKEYADALLKAGTPELLNEQPVGTGPYQFVARYPDAVTYAANPGYWRGAQKISLLAFLSVPDAADRLAKLQSGRCQIAADLDPASLKAAKGDSSLAVATTQRLDLAYLAFNTTQKPFDDPRVRKALGYAIDKDAIVAAVYGGGASAANTVMPHSMWSYDGSLLGDFHSVDRAKELLAEAGVKDLKVKLLATRSPRPYSPNSAEVGVMISRDLAKVGVQATLSVPDQLGDYFRQSTAKDRDGAVVIGWTSDNGDPDNFLSLLFSCAAVGSSNRAQWCDEDLSKLLDKARVASDPAQRLALYSQAQQMIGDKAPIIAIAHSLVAVPMSKKVTGFMADPLGHHNFEGVDIAP